MLNLAFIVLYIFDSTDNQLQNFLDILNDSISKRELQ